MEKINIVKLFQSQNLQSGKIRKGLLYIFGIMFLVGSFGFLLAGGSQLHGTRMTAVEGGSTFTTSSTMTLKVGDYIVPSLTTDQARMVTANATDKTFSVSPPYTSGVTSQPFTILHAVTNPNEESKQVVIFPTRGKSTNNLQLQTFTVKSCQQPTVVNFLIDVSGSMADTRKVKKQTREKEALRAFTGRMTDNYGIGIQVFSKNTQEKVPLKLFKDARAQVKTTIDKLPTQTTTHSRDGLKLSLSKLSASISKKQFPGYKYVLIFLTDGVPEDNGVPDTAENCLAMTTQDDGDGIRCFAKSQDPRGTLTDKTNIGKSIKDLGVEVYSIGITSNESPSDKFMKPYLESMLINVASTPTKKHYYSSQNGENLSVVLDNVFNDICNEQTEAKTIPAP